jgi:hypothetical protein
MKNNSNNSNHNLQDETSLNAISLNSVPTETDKQVPKNKRKGGAAPKKRDLVKERIQAPISNANTSPK